MEIKRISYLLCLVGYFWFSLSSSGQTKYWIHFTDKDTVGYDYQSNLSSACIQHRINQQLPLVQYSDIPVNSYYVSTIQQHSVKHIATSKWMNAVTAYLTVEQKEYLSSQAFIAYIEPVTIELIATETTIATNPKYMHVSMQQMNGLYFQTVQLDGKGVKVGVIDAGFYELDKNPLLMHLLDENKIKGQRDFIDGSRTDLIKTKATGSDFHGMEVMLRLAGYDSTKQHQIGMAPNASYYFARTEHGDREYRGEEDMWIMAMEWMDSLGVQLISTSLGYATKMDDPNDNYKKEEMDGKTTRITKAAEIAVKQKGIFLVVSAGNEGAKDWRIISAPADAYSALSVAANGFAPWKRESYSSVGPEMLPYVKPNVSAYSLNGTSFSCPSVAGFVTCLIQFDSTATPEMLKKVVEKSAHIYPFANNYLGNGVPQADRALSLMKDTSITVGKSIVLELKGKRKRIALHEYTSKTEFTVMHKSSPTNVIADGVLVNLHQNVMVVRPKNALYSTLTADKDVVVEIIWK
ncbi:MAG: S8 family serine peptidase [Cytophagaceae bacterium]